MIARKRARFDKAGGGLRPAALRRETSQKRAEISRLGERLRPAIERRVKRLREYYLAQARVLDSVSYERVLARGFALVTRGDGLVRSAGSVAEGDALKLRFADGEVAATAGKGSPGKPPAPAVEAPRPRIRRPKRESDTGDLF
jgi:exodeoxyribonuclease VII large subunit